MANINAYAPIYPSNYSSMMDSVLPQYKSNIITNTLAVVLGTILLAVSAQIYIPLPFTPVPITAQTLSVMLIGSMLGSRRAPVSVLLYVLLGSFGLPVFSEGKAGVEVLYGATGGYIVGFFLSAYLVGKFTEYGFDRTILKNLFSMTVGQLIIFVPGLLWLGLYVGYENVFALGFYPFIIGGVVKTLLASTSSVLLWKFIKKIS